MNTPSSGRRGGVPPLWRGAAVVALTAACATTGHATSSAPAATATPDRSATGTHAVRHPIAIPRVSRPAHLARVAADPVRLGGRWTTVAMTGHGAAIAARVMALPDGATVTVFRFRAGVTSFALHAGSQDPGPVRGSRHGDRVTGAERSRLLAAFNGAFKVSAGTGGYVQDGTVVRPLQSGLATFAVDAAGRAAVGVWQHGLPQAGDRVVSAVQNLSPLITNGRISSRIDERLAWGATLGHVLAVARSGVGEDARGDLLYAGSMLATPRDLATALRVAGSVDAMELDINPEWVQFDFATQPGAALQAGIPLQHRPATQVLTGWTRSFITCTAIA